MNMEIRDWNFANVKSFEEGLWSNLRYAINYQKGKIENTLIILKPIVKCFKAPVVHADATNNGSNHVQK